MLTLRPYITPTIHLLAWLLFGLLLLFLPPLSWQITLPFQFWVRQFIILLLLAMVFYLNTSVLVPRYLFTNKNILFVILILGLSIVVMYVLQVFEIVLNLPELMHKAIHPESTDPPRNKGFHFDMFTLLIVFLVQGIGTSISVVERWQKDHQLRKELEQEKVSSELSFLKAQINPHFFFNTLNNIYALTLVNVELARKALHKLSRMMRYVLYETPRDTTLLSQEIAFLQDYISLMQLRLTDKANVCFEHPESLHDTVIAPMLLLPFVENAFKHGISTQDPSKVLITIKQQGKALIVEVENSIFTRKAALIEEGSGIGLTNTKRRLDLLYPGRHTLTVHDHTEENKFRVQLTLQL